MDRIDRDILSFLQVDARQSVTALAELVGVSVSSCHRRLRELEAAGVVSGYRARLDPRAVGFGFMALVNVTMREGDADVLSRFEDALRDIPEITDANRMFGDPDYMVRVATADLESFQRLYDERLSRLPGVLRLSTTLIMKEIIADRPLPL